MGNKRDSFKLLSSSGSSKDQLHTLLEEEEEEEEEEVEPQGKKGPEASLPSPTTSNEDDHSLPLVTWPPAVTKPAPTRPRPATLNLRPLSLTPENIGSTTGQGLPTPSLTPSPRPGFRSISVIAETDESPPTAPRPVAASSRRPVLNLSMDSTSDTSFGDDQKSIRRSSISYKHSSYANSGSFGLPTPEATPTFSRRSSTSDSIRSSKSGDEDFFPAQAYRPLSASEQHFLHKSHNALLARITDLEKALSMRRMSMSGYSITGGSRPSSVLSDASFPIEAGSPGDEMFTLIGDLKAERDELKKDVDGWRTRVADLDKQLGLVAKRVETERREAWVARSRVGLLEAEKGVLDKRLEALDQVVATLEAEKLDLEKQNQRLKEESEVKGRRADELELELKRVKQELESEREERNKHCSNTRKDLSDDSMATPTPQTFDNQDKWKRGLAFTTMDLDSEGDCLFNFGLPLKAVQQEDGDGYSDEEDGLAGYEDEEESDPEMETSSSFGSDDYSQAAAPRFPAIEVAPVEEKALSHRSRHSLSRVWTFPKLGPAPAGIHGYSESVDRSFDESDASDESGPVTPMPLNYEDSKDLFASGFKFGNDDDALFCLPGGVGTVVEEPTPELKNERKLSAVTEEDEEAEVEDALSDMEEDEEMFGEIGGIRIICTPPDDVQEEKEVEQIVFTSAKPVSTPPMLPAFDFGHDENDEEEEEKERNPPFMFGRPMATAESTVPKETPTLSPVLTPPSPPRSVPTMITPSSTPRSVSPRASSIASAIPRPASRTSTVNSRPPRSTSSPSAYVTPPTKRGGAIPSFIPQPVTSPSPSRIMPISRPKAAIPGPTFIRSPNRAKPFTPLTPNTNTSKPYTTTSDIGSAPKPNYIRTFD